LIEVNDVIEAEGEIETRRKDMTNDTMILTRRALIGLAATGTVVFVASGLRGEMQPAVTVWKDPNCGCCSGWVEHLRRNGFDVSVNLASDMSAIKARHGVPAELASCHTATVAGYVIEGHVPAQAIARLLAEKPAAVGLAVAGMPSGAPGMEGGTVETYDVVLFGRGGHRSFARFKGAQPI
jgi:hypothetical protein